MSSQDCDVQVEPDFGAYWSRQRQLPLYVILGSQGSGTNLLANVLETAFRFSVVRDRSLVIKAATKILDSSASDVVAQQYRRVCGALFPNEFRKRWMTKKYFHQADHYQGIDEFFDARTVANATDFAEFFYCYHAFREEARFRAIKSDDLWEEQHRLNELFPNLRYLLLMRDPRDNVLSVMNKDFGPCEIYSASQYVKHRIRKHEELLEASDSPHVVVHYERLLNEPLAVVEQISEGLAIEPNEDHAIRLSELNIRSTNMRKWERLPSRSLAICESVLADVLERYGYDLASQERVTPASAEVAMRRTSDLIQRVPQRVTKYVRRFLRP